MNAQKSAVATTTIMSVDEFQTWAIARDGYYMITLSGAIESGCGLKAAHNVVCEMADALPSDWENQGFTSKEDAEHQVECWEHIAPAWGELKGDHITYMSHCGTKYEIRLVGGLVEMKRFA